MSSKSRTRLELEIGQFLLAIGEHQWCKWNKAFKW
jgi:hypothetical protein